MQREIYIDHFYSEFRKNFIDLKQKSRNFPTDGNRLNIKMMQMLRNLSFMQK